MYHDFIKLKSPDQTTIMNRRIFLMKLARTIVLVLPLAFFAAPSVWAQDKSAASQFAPAIDEKAEKILARAVEALGGSNYLNVRSSIGRGLYTPFKDNVSGV